MKSLAGDFLKRRRFTVGKMGGSNPAFFAGYHRAAMRLCRQFEVVAGAFPSNPVGASAKSFLQLLWQNIRGVVGAWFMKWARCEETGRTTKLAGTVVGHSRIGHCWLELTKHVGLYWSAVDQWPCWRSVVGQRVCL
jgi:hypothetical protein